MDSASIAALIHGAPGFVATLQPRVLSSSKDGAELRLDAGPELHNHLGGPHAAAIFGLGETAAFVVLLEVFGELVEAGTIPLVKSAEISYTAVVTGPLLASSRMLGDEQSTRERLAERGVATFPVEISFRRETDDVPTALMTAQMTLRQR